VREPGRCRLGQLGELIYRRWWRFHCAQSECALPLLAGVSNDRVGSVPVHASPGEKLSTRVVFLYKKSLCGSRADACCGDSGG